MTLVDINLNNFEVKKRNSSASVLASRVSSGKQITPRQHLLLYSADEWEVFLEEWAQFQITQYHKVVNLGGAHDFGIDIAGFCTDKGFQGEWDNFQCKYYKNDPLTPGIAIPEIAKILWHAHKAEITLPRQFFFFAPKDCGAALKKLLLDAGKLKEKLISEWDKWCSETITSKKVIKLEGQFLQFVDGVDFNLFQYKPTGEVLEEHRKTPFFCQRFGGGLPDRPTSVSPPGEHLESESRYITQLFEAYSNKECSNVTEATLSAYSALNRHFNRQREAFFHAESLEAFARDTVPQGTFSSLQEEIFSGVVDISEDEHSNGFERLKAVTHAAGVISLDTNGLIQVTKVQDRRGICHQLANEDRLTWVPGNE